MTRCKFRGRPWHFVTCHENRRKRHTKRRFCSRSIRKLVGKRWFWCCEVWKLPCLWEKAQKRVFFDVSQDVLMSFCAAGDIRLWGARPSWGWSCCAYVKSCKNVSFFRRVTRCAHVVLRGRRVTLWHFTCVRCATIVRLKLPCLCEKLQKRVFFDVSQHVLMSFCVAGVALCDIPRVWGAPPSWGWSCRAYVKSCRNVSFSTCHNMFSCRFAWQAWHFVTFLVWSRLWGARPSWGWSCCAYEKSCKNVSFSTCHNMFSCRFAWQALHFVTFHVCEVRHPHEAEVAVPMWKVAETCLFRRVTTCSHVVLRGRRGTLWHSSFDLVCEVHDPREAEVAVPMKKVAKTCLFRRVTTCAHVVLRGRRGTLDVSCCVFSVNRDVSAARSDDKVQILWQGWHCVTGDEKWCRRPHRFWGRSTLYSTLYTLYAPHFTLSTLHCTPHTLDFPLSIFHSTLYTLGLNPHTLHSTLYTPHFTLYTPHFTLYTLHFTLHTLHSPHLTLHPTPYTPHFTLHTPHFTLHTLHFTPRTLHSTLYTLHSTLHTLHSSLHTLHTTL